MRDLWPRSRIPRQGLLPTQTRRASDLETDPKKVLELLVGLPEMSVLGVDTSGPVVELHVEKLARVVGCPTCGVVAQFKGWREVVLIDLPAFGKPTRLHWHKRRWRCADSDCAMGSWTEQDLRIAAPRMATTDRAGRWVPPRWVATRKGSPRGGQGARV